MYNRWGGLLTATVQTVNYLRSLRCVGNKGKFKGKHFGKTKILMKPSLELLK